MVYLAQMTAAAYHGVWLMWTTCVASSKCNQSVHSSNLVTFASCLNSVVHILLKWSFPERFVSFIIPSLPSHASLLFNRNLQFSAYYSVRAFMSHRITFDDMPLRFHYYRCGQWYCRIVKILPASTMESNLLLPCFCLLSPYNSVNYKRHHVFVACPW